MAQHEVFERYPYDTELMHTQRDFSWEIRNRLELQSSVDTAITALGLDESWEKIHADPLKEALANGLFSSVLSCYGPNISADTLLALNQKRFGDTFTETPTDIRFTSNHLSVTGRVTPLDSDGQPIEGPSAVIHMPTFATNASRKPTIGDLSPISISEQNGEFQLNLSTPSGKIWRKRFAVIPASVNQVQSHDIGLPCASGYQVMVLRPTCQEDCAMCTVSRGRGFIPESYWKQVSQTLDLLIDEAVKNNHAFQQTLSGGSISDYDGGFKTAHLRALSMIEEKVARAERRKHSRSPDQERKIPIQLELEMILPLDKNEWAPIIEQLHQYVTDTSRNWKISLAINMEVLHDEWKGLFLKGPLKGATTLEDHIEFANLLKKKTCGNIQMNTLVMFGMKPAAMSYGEYMTEDLRVFQKLIAAGIHAEYAPLKIESGTTIEAYPPPNPVFFMIQFAAIKQMMGQANLPWSPGCVGACSLCHNPGEIRRLLGTTKKRNISLPEIFKPILEKLGLEYTSAFTEIFSNATQ